ncbi:MAG: hypothetical protein ACRDRD_21460, partial [Pseudonocardiaceae bacterium]
IKELDTRRARYRIAGPGTAPGLTTSCTPTATGFTVQFQSHGRDLRSLFGPRLIFGLADRSATGTAIAQVTFGNGVRSVPPNISGGWVNKAAPNSSPPWQLTASSDLQTLDATWTGGPGHTGLHGTFHGSLTMLNRAYAYTGSFNVTEGGGSVNGAMTVAIDNANQVEITLQPSGGQPQHYTFIRGAPRVGGR